MCKSGKSHIGGSGDRFEPFRWFSRTGGHSYLRDLSSDPGTPGYWRQLRITAGPAKTQNTVTAPRRGARGDWPSPRGEGAGGGYPRPCPSPPSPHLGPRPRPGTLTTRAWIYIIYIKRRPPSNTNRARSERKRAISKIGTSLPESLGISHVPAWRRAGLKAVSKLAFQRI